jgi:hypothetical protein
MEETDSHLFFARAAWFNHPWFIRSDVLILDANSLTDIVLKLINMNHPHATMANILTFMWCLWKSRNDNLFNRKQTHPSQIHYMANALQQNMEMFDVLQDNKVNNQVCSRQQQMKEEAQKLPPKGHTIKTDLQITGSKLFSDAAWKTKSSRPGFSHSYWNWCVLYTRPHAVHFDRDDSSFSSNYSVSIQGVNSKKPPHLWGKYLEPPVLSEIAKNHRFCLNTFQYALILVFSRHNKISDMRDPLSG